MERTVEYRGCRIDASVVTNGARLKLSTVYQVTPLTEQAVEVLGGQWKRITKAGTQNLRDAGSCGEDPLRFTMELTLRLAAEAIDDVFAVQDEQAKVPVVEHEGSPTSRRIDS